MKTRITATLSAVLLMLGLAGPAHAVDYTAPGAEATVADGTAASADEYQDRPTGDGLPGCFGKYRAQASTWILDTTYTVPDEWTITREAPVRLTANAIYWFCPNGARPDKVRVLYVDYCVTHWQDKHWIFDGVKFNPYFADLDSVSNPPTVKVDDSGGLQDCASQDISSSLERWLKISQMAQWSLTSWIVRVGSTDEERLFKTDTASTRKRFAPSTDAVLGAWENVG